jgi:hypothetical protein
MVVDSSLDVLGTHTRVTFVGRVGKGIVVASVVSHPVFGVCYVVKVSLGRRRLDEAPRFADDAAKLECGREEHLEKWRTRRTLYYVIYTCYYMNVTSARDITYDGG